MLLPRVGCPPTHAARGWPMAYALSKRLFDVDLFRRGAAPLFPCWSRPALLLLNPIFNPGPLFYRPERMGRDLPALPALQVPHDGAGGDAAGRGPDDPWRPSA
jgi:hypothetical protein